MQTVSRDTNSNYVEFENSSYLHDRPIWNLDEMSPLLSDNGRTCNVPDPLRGGGSWLPPLPRTPPVLSALRASHERASGVFL